MPPGLDIGTSHVRLLQLAYGQNRELEVVRCDEESYSASGKPATFEQQKGALLKLLERNRGVRQVVTGISGRQAQVYHLTFPAMSKEELDTAIRWKLSQLKPFGQAVETIRYDFRRLDEKIPSQEKAKQHKVLVICVSQETTERHLALLSAAGVVPYALEILPMSLVNLSRFLSAVGTREETVLWIDLRADESVLSIEKGGQVYFFRSLATVMSQLTQQIARNMNVSLAEAETLKRLHGLSHWTPDLKPEMHSEGSTAEKAAPAVAVYQSIASSLENLIVDIEHSFKYFSYQISQSQITRFDRVMLSGGGANLRNFDSFLTTRLGVPVQKVNPFSALKISDGLGARKKLLTDSAAEYASVAGLSVAPAVKATDRINLLPKSASRRIDLSSLKKSPIKMGALAAGVLAILFGIPIEKAARTGRQAEAVSMELSQLESELKESRSLSLRMMEKETELSKKADLLKARWEFLDKASEEPRQFSQVLRDLASALPEEIWIKRLLYKDGKLSVQGASVQASSVLDFIDKLKTKSVFSAAVFNYTEKTSEEQYYTFQILVNVA